MNRYSIAAAIVAATIGFGSAAQAQDRAEAVGVVSHLNLLSNHSEDISTLEAWKNTYIKDGMSEQEKAIAIFNTIVRYRHQANPPREFLSSELSGGHVHDPLKTAHVYGYSQCCCTSANVQGLARYLGLPARGRPITVHSVAEVFYDDSWHLIDPSVMNYHLKECGTIASVDEIHEAVAKWLEEHPQFAEGEIGDRDRKLRTFAKNHGWKKGPSLLAGSEKFYGEHGVNTAGWHGWSSTMIEYSKVEEPDEFWAQMGYQLNVQLRPGEKITRNFFSRGLDYTNKCSTKYYAEMLDRKYFGIQTDMGDIAPGRVGDGTAEWTVPMEIEQLKAVAFSADNLASFGRGVGAADPSQPGVLILHFPSSYIYVKGLMLLDMNRGQGGITVSVSDNNGVDWKPLLTQEQGGGRAIDLTPFIQKRYDYRLKFEMAGQGTSLNAVRTVNHFQCSQAALPAISEGENTLTFRAGPSEGTITIEGATDFDEARKQEQLAIIDFKPVLKGVDQRLRMSSGQGEATFSIAAPGDITRIRTSIGWRARDARDQWQVQVSYDGGSSFHDVPDGTLQGGTTGETRYLTIANVPTGTREAKLRLAGKQVNTTQIVDLRIDADYAQPAGGFKPVKITYLWEEDGKPVSHVHVARSPNEAFTLTAGANSVPRSFTMELAD
jgi:hypothetical protein